MVLEIPSEFGYVILTGTASAFVLMYKVLHWPKLHTNVTLKSSVKNVTITYRDIKYADFFIGHQCWNGQKEVWNQVPKNVQWWKWRRQHVQLHSSNDFLLITNYWLLTRFLLPLFSESSSKYIGELPPVSLLLDNRRPFSSNSFVNRWNHLDGRTNCFCQGILHRYQCNLKNLVLNIRTFT